MRTAATACQALILALTLAACAQDDVRPVYGARTLELPAGFAAFCEKNPAYPACPKP